MKELKIDLAMLFYMRDNCQDPEHFKALNNTILLQSKKLNDNEILEIRSKLLTFIESF